MWGEAYFWVSYAPYRKGMGPSATQFWGSLLFMLTPFDAELYTKFYVVTDKGRGLFLGG